jgi:REP element-mobilizing transposase RayT
MGYGEALLGDSRIANMVQNSLLKFDEERYRLHAWVIMPNHFHCLLIRQAELEIEEILKRFKGYTARQANKILGRKGQFWIEDYFDRWMRNEKHFRRTVSYIELNPVKARLCSRAEDWPFSSAWYRHQDEPKR